jgi:hypothetical protein
MQSDRLPSTSPRSVNPSIRFRPEAQSPQRTTRSSHCIPARPDSIVTFSIFLPASQTAPPPVRPSVICPPSSVIRPPSSALHPPSSSSTERLRCTLVCGPWSCPNLADFFLILFLIPLSSPPTPEEERERERRKRTIRRVPAKLGHYSGRTDGLKNAAALTLLGSGPTGSSPPNPNFP